MELSAARPRPRVVVGVSRSPAGYAALHAAVGVARGRGLQLVAVRATTVADVTAKLYIEHAFADAFGAVPDDLDVEEVLMCDCAVGALARAAPNPADLIVVGSSDHGSFRALWSGRVGRSLLKQAHCPVLVVPPPEMQRATRRSARRLGRGRTDVWDRFETEVAESSDRSPSQRA